MEQQTKWIIFKDYKAKNKGDAEYLLVPKEVHVDNCRTEDAYECVDENGITILRSANNIFNSKADCEKAIRRCYQDKIANWLENAIEILRNNLRD